MEHLWQINTLSNIKSSGADKAQRSRKGKPRGIKYGTSPFALVAFED